MNAHYLNEANYLVMMGRLPQLKKLWADYRQKFHYIPDEQYYTTFRLLFTNACQNGKTEIAQWLHRELYEKLLTREQHEKLRPTFDYCFRYVKKFPRFIHTATWLERITIKMRDDFGGPQESARFQPTVDKTKPSPKTKPDPKSGPTKSEPKK